jgi:hypothetical protein
VNIVGFLLYLPGGFQSLKNSLQEDWLRRRVGGTVRADKVAESDLKKESGTR